MSLLNEGLSNPQQAASGGLLHDAVVVTGVHRTCAVGMKDTHVEIMHAACRVFLFRSVQSCIPSDMKCSVMELPTVSGSVRPRSRKLRDVSGSVRAHMKIADRLRLCAPARTKMVGRLRRLGCPG